MLPPDHCGHELQAAPHAGLGQRGMHAAREAEGGLGGQVVLLGRAADVDEVPGRAFQQDVDRALPAQADLAMRLASLPAPCASSTSLEAS